MAKCKSLKSDGSKCKAHAMQNSGYCFLHNPDCLRERKSAQIKGANTPKKLLKPLKPIEIQDSKDVVKLISETINEVRGGKMQPRIANCLGYLCGIMLNAFETSSLQEKMEELERKISENEHNDR